MFVSVDNIRVDVGEVGYESGRWMEVAQYLFQWRYLVSVVMKSVILLPQLISDMPLF
jgi:hypothetical protein